MGLNMKRDCAKCVKSMRTYKKKCNNHNPECCTCYSCYGVFYDTKVRLKLANCGHTFCVFCLGKSVLETYPHSFSTENIICCMKCKTPVIDSEWQKITCNLVDNRLLKRTAFYSYHLDKKNFNALYRIIELYREYNENENIFIHFSTREIITINPEAEIVYFNTPFNNDPVFTKNWYNYRIDYSLLRSQNETLFKELVEYVFHPKRVERFGGWEYLDQI